MCFGVNATDTLSVCSGRGVCTSPDTCVCSSNSYFGDLCEFSSADQPVAILKAPTEISQCGKLFLDGSLSYNVGSGSLSFTFRADSGTNKDTINAHLDSLSESVVEIPLSLMDFNPYVFSLRVNSSEGFLSLAVQRTVTKVSTVSMNVFIEGPQQLTVYRSENLVLKGTADIISCFGSLPLDDIVYTWAQIGGPLSVNGTTQNGKQLLIPAFSLPLQADAAFTFELRAQLSAVVATEFVSVTVIPRPLQASIAGGDRQVSSKQEVTIDASQSSDPDGVHCVPLYEFSCGTNCPSQIKTLLQDGDIANPIRSIAANTLSMSQVYTFNVNFTKCGRSDVASVTYSVTAEDSVQVSIDPISIVNRNERLVLNARIDNSNSQLTDMIRSTFWEVTSRNLVLDTSTLVNRVEAKSRLQLALKENILTPGETYTFRFTLFTAVSQVYATTQVKVNDPPQYGSVVLSTSNATQYETEITARAMNWYDEQLPLRYSYEYIDPTTSKVVLLSPYSLENHFKFFLSEPGAVTVRVRVRDALGGISAAEGIVYVQPAAPSDAANVLHTSRSLSKMSSTTPQEVQEVLRDLRLSVDYLNAEYNEPDSCSQDKTCIEPYETFRNDVIQKLSNTKLSILSISAEEEEIIVDVLARVTKKNDQIPTIAAENALNVLKSVTCNQQFSQRESYGNIVATYSNILDAALVADPQLANTTNSQAIETLQCVLRQIQKDHVNGESMTTFSSPHYELALFKDVVELLREQATSELSTEKFGVVLSPLLGEDSLLQTPLSMGVILSTVSPYDAPDQASVSTVDLTFYKEDGSVYHVYGLEEAPLTMTLGATSSSALRSSLESLGEGQKLVCKYWDPVTGRWRSDGVTVVSSNAMNVTCESTHTSTFSAFIVGESADIDGEIVQRDGSTSTIVWIAVGVSAINLVGFVCCILIVLCFLSLCGGTLVLRRTRRKREETHDDAHVDAREFVPIVIDDVQLRDVPLEPDTSSVVTPMTDDVDQLKQLIRDKDKELKAQTCRMNAIEVTIERLKEKANTLKYDINTTQSEQSMQQEIDMKANMLQRCESRIQALKRDLNEQGTSPKGTVSVQQRIFSLNQELSSAKQKNSALRRHILENKMSLMENRKRLHENHFQKQHQEKGDASSPTFCKRQNLVKDLKHEKVKLEKFIEVAQEKTQQVESKLSGRESQITMLQEMFQREQQSHAQLMGTLQRELKASQAEKERLSSQLFDDFWSQ